MIPRTRATMLNNPQYHHLAAKVPSLQCIISKAQRRRLKTLPRSKPRPSPAAMPLSQTANPRKIRKLWAISDIHLAYPINRESWEQLRSKPHDGLIIAGDVGETVDHLRLALETAVKRFAHVWWVPGNHELYSVPVSRASESGNENAKKEEPSRAEVRYHEFVAVAREFGVSTPEDDYIVWPPEDVDALDEGASPWDVEAERAMRARICPIFTLYDYSFRPPEVTRENALTWAQEQDIMATDEALLHPDPYSTRDEWCAKLCKEFEAKLSNASTTPLLSTNESVPLVIINHWPLRESLVRLVRIPRFSLWCGTKITDDWHKRFHAKVVVTGHLHIRRTDWQDGCRFEEVSLGYPRQWEDSRAYGLDVNDFLREILPGPEKEPEGWPEGQTRWRPHGGA
jgi:predicted phosphodiesterase